MIDVTSHKVSIPSLLFLSLTPGVLLGVRGTGISLHAMVFMLVYFLVAKAMRLVLTKTDLVATTLLFVILSPGLLVAIPRDGGRHTAVVHAALYAIIFALLRRQFPQYY
jgi:hypothetical protein